MPVAATNSESGKKGLRTSVCIGGSESAPGRDLRVESSRGALPQPPVGISCPPPLLCSATQPFLQAGSMAPAAPAPGSGWRCRTAHLRGGQRRACSRADLHIAGGQWPGARLVGEAALRTWPLEDGLGVEDSPGLGSPPFCAHQMGGVKQHVPEMGTRLCAGLQETLRGGCWLRRSGLVSVEG